MPCGAVFENTTGLTKRKCREYTEEELAYMMTNKQDILLDFQYLAGSKSTRIFPHQTKVAKDIVSGYNGGNLVHSIVVSPTQSGKTGIIFETVRYFIQDTNIPIKNIYIITGHSSVEWKKQTKERLPKKLQARVFHRSDLNSDFYSDIERKKNVLIILDEIQIASAKDQTIHKVFDALNFMNLETLLKRDVKFIEITATPNGCIYDLMKWGPEFSRKIIVEPPEPYTSCFKLLDTGRVKQYADLCDDIVVDKKIVKAIDNVKELKNTIDDFYGDDYRFHFIRTKAAESQDKTKNNFKQVFGDDVKIIEFDMENKESDINNIVADKPDQHIFVFIKEKLRCAKTIENKKIVGVYYERYTNTLPDDDVMIQGMLGRATGYNDNGDSIIYTNISSIEKYRTLLLSKFDDMTVNWLSSSTQKVANKIRTKNFFNTPDNVRGFKVVEYDLATETAEEKRSRIAAQKQEKEHKKAEKELAKAEKLRLKQEKEKEKEAKKQEREAKQKEREAMKKAKEALKAQQKKEKEDLKEQKKKEKEHEKAKAKAKNDKSNDKDIEKANKPHKSNKKDDDEDNDIDIDGQVTLENKSNFRMKLKKELMAYAKEYKEINKKEISKEVINEYINTICTSTFVSERFSDDIAEYGDPNTWTNDVFQEYISDHSDLHKKYPLENDENDEIEREEEEEEPEPIPEPVHVPEPQPEPIRAEDVPEIMPKRKKLNKKRIIDEE